MRTTYFQVFIASIFIAGLISCNDKKEEYPVERINIDFNNIKEIDIRDSSKIKMLTLEVTDLSLLMEIKDVEFLNSKILVYTNNQIVVFSREGEFLFNIDRTGNGPGEYVRTSSFFVRGDSIFLYDDISLRLLAYDENGEFLSSFRTDEEISLIYPLSDHTYIAKNKYRGDNNKTPAICLVDGNLAKIGDASNRFLSSANMGFDNFYPFGDEVLYWEFLNDTIFSITRQLDVYPKYFVDFNNYRIPKHIMDKNNENEILDYINNSDNPNIAAAIKYICEDSENIRFIFVQKEAILNYARYNKENKEAAVFRITDSQNKMVPQLFMKYRNGEIIMSALEINDVDMNPLLFFIDEKYLQ